MTVKSCVHTLLTTGRSALAGWIIVNVAVVTVVLTGADASQRATSADADEATAMTASAATATARMIFFKRNSCFLQAIE